MASFVDIAFCEAALDHGNVNKVTPDYFSLASFALFFGIDHPIGISVTRYSIPVQTSEVSPGRSARDG
jgi:hypothetical protein